jgi:hypothetical protein
MKASELSGVQLDWAVFEAEYGTQTYEFTDAYKPSEDWAQGGSIIERERIRLDPRGVWVAGHDSSNDEYLGATPLIAAMRCYVASKLGEEVEIPEELK